MTLRRTRRFQNTRRSWSPSEIIKLRACAKRKLPAPRIAEQFRRTEGAVRMKAFALGLSLETRNVA
jgi:hypothetical protein